MSDLPAAVPVGFRILTANLGVKDDTTDFCLVVADGDGDGVTSAGAHTQSRFAGPSVALSRDAAGSGHARAIVVVSKNANVANGTVGDADAAELQALAATLAGCEPSQVAPASTGVIGRPYPMDRMRAAIGALPVPEPADSAAFLAAATAIMTTDTHAKVAASAVGASGASIVGIAKGVGMIEPNMATLLTYFFTDAAVPADDLDAIFRRVIATTFNALSIDTDTSTSDTAVVLANGAAGSVDAGEFETALHDVALRLVLMIAADGEGASKVIEVRVTGARDDVQAKLVAKAIVNSPLVKTAVHGADPNWGRIVMAIGKCDDQTDIDPDRVRVGIGDIEMFPATADLVAAEEHMRGDRAVITAHLGIAAGEFTAYGCDLTDGYIRINADYTT